MVIDSRNSTILPKRGALLKINQVISVKCTLEVTDWLAKDGYLPKTPVGGLGYTVHLTITLIKACRTSCFKPMCINIEQLAPLSL